MTSVTIRFSRTKQDFAGNVQNTGEGGGNSEETTRLARTGTRHDFLIHGDLLRASLYGRQEWDSVLDPQQILFVEHSNIHHARVKAKLVTVKAAQGTCLWTKWCEVLLLHKSQHLNKDTKDRKKVSFKLNENYLNIPSVSMNLKMKRTDTINSIPSEIGNLGENSQL